jgi:predicted exporter
MKELLRDAGWLTALWGALAAAFIVSCVVLFAGEAPLQTNLMLLLPPTERNPVAERAVTALADAAGNRAVFLIGHREPAKAKDAARRFAAGLRAGGLDRVQLEIGPIDPRRIVDFYAPYRFMLLSDRDRAALARGSGELENRLRQKLYSPIRAGLTAAPSLDPFGLLDAWLGELPLGSIRLEPEDGLLVARGANSTYVLVSAGFDGSAYDNAAQEKALAAVTAAEAALRRDVPDSEILRTGTVFFAHAARVSAAREMDVIGVGSLIGVVILMLWVFRSPRPLLLGLLSVGIGISAAISCTVLVFGELFLLTLVFGASLIGEAIDYSIQYFSARLGAGADWEAGAGLKRILPGLSVALATSVLGYASLLLVPFPALRQIGFFALVGLTVAYISVVLLLPLMLRKASQRDVEAVVATPRRMLAWWRRHMTSRACLVLMAALLLLSIPGLLRLSGDDDIRLLINRPPALVAQAEQIRTLTGVGNSSQFFLVEGQTPQQVLENEQRLGQRLRALVAGDGLNNFQAITSFVPSAAQQHENRALWERAVFGNPAQLRTMLTREGLRDEVIAALVADFQRGDGKALEPDAWLESPLSTPYRHLWLGQTAQGYASVVVPNGARDIGVLDDAARDLPGVMLVDKARSVSRLFHELRQWGGLWLFSAAILVFLVLRVRYGWRDGAAMLAPTLLAMGVSLGLFGYLGVSITLFNLMGLMLVLGVGVNYAIFLREGGASEAATLLGVLMSAATTLLSFGLLALSSMPALHNFGLSLLSGIGIAVLLAPMVLSFRRDPVCAN